MGIADGNMKESGHHNVEGSTQQFAAGIEFSLYPNSVSSVDLRKEEVLSPGSVLTNGNHSPVHYLHLHFNISYFQLMCTNCTYVLVCNISTYVCCVMITLWSLPHLSIKTCHFFILEESIIISLKWSTEYCQLGL